MKPLTTTRPFPACILPSGHPARDHRKIDLAITIARNTPPIQKRAETKQDRRAA